MSYPVQVIIAAAIIISITGGILAALHAVSLLLPPVNWETVRSTLRTFAQDGDVEVCDLCGDEADEDNPIVISGSETACAVCESLGAIDYSATA